MEISLNLQLKISAIQKLSHNQSDFLLMEDILPFVVTVTSSFINILNSRMLDLDKGTS
jgi:hypothetical protein